MTSSTQFDADYNLLDMFSCDMDFEQAYSMYNNLQQNKLMGSFEDLQKVQMLNQQYTTNIPPSQAQNTDYDYGRQQIINKNYQMHTQDSFDEFDQFFTNNESNALEKFLDNLANPNSLSTNPLQFYKQNLSQQHSPILNNELDFNFDLHTMKLPKRNESTTSDSCINLKKELTEAFTNPSHHSNFHNQLPTPVDSRTNSSNQLITPPTSGDELSINKNKRHNSSDEDESEEEGKESKDEAPKKRRRSSNKPLLSLEQKRLNHSHSEQKRRQLCKLAYQRCLELIINIDAFNKLPELNEAERKSKRARVNKDGLPNLSKHNALIRISNEMLTIKSKNDALKKLLESS
ncbi:unnamed protein product [Candida verbasci]|uniref:BHLH domain-containing protein n=1 Tax=Candida verbasci TaxID=1227364 RepID=A0A9W4TRX3_9ASCO|nr:unnamed protein product [Candida verbasci]